MTKLTFKAADVRRVVEHALAASKHMSVRVSYAPDVTEDRGPQILLVHDDGVYLMSSGEPRDLDDQYSGPSEKTFVAYAEGTDPRVAGFDHYHVARELVGGDDFVDYLPWANDIKRRLDDGDETIAIGFSPSSLKLI